MFADRLSYREKVWEYHAPSQDDLTLFQRLTLAEKLPNFLIEFFIRREIAPENVMDYLMPRVKNSLPDPYQLPDMETALTRIAHAIRQKETIGLYSDYDVDGACSAALFINYLNALDVPHCLYIPSRLNEGYGVHPTGLQQLHTEGASLIICSDCGTGLPADTAHAVPCDIIIFDHHQSVPPYPDVFAFVNPMRADDQSGQRTICAAAICFLVLIGINRLLREQLDFHDDLPDLMNALDLVALATIADVMPLHDLSRSLVAQGMKVMNKKNNIGLDMLNQMTRQGKDISHSEDISFGLAPYLNAGGRMGESLTATQLLSAQNIEEARYYVQRLQKLNSTRIERQNECLTVIHQMIADDAGLTHDTDCFILLGAEDLHVGITGIAAGKVKDKYHVPCLIVSYDAQGIGTGSARSVKGIDIAHILKMACDTDILLRAGGHAMAGGFTLAKQNEESFREFLRSHLPHQDNSEKRAAKNLAIDVVCSIPHVSSQQISWLAALSPFGNGNPEPFFAIPHLRVKYCKMVGKKHNHLMVICENAAGETLRGIFFNAENAAGDALRLCYETGSKIHLAGFLRVNDYQGKRSIDITICDVMAA